MSRSDNRPARRPVIENSSADAKTWSRKPHASSRSLVAPSMLRSSSTTATIFCRLGMGMSRPDRGELCTPRRSRDCDRDNVSSGPAPGAVPAPEAPAAKHHSNMIPEMAEAQRRGPIALVRIRSWRRTSRFPKLARVTSGSVRSAWRDRPTSRENSAGWCRH